MITINFIESVNMIANNQFNGNIHAAVAANYKEILETVRSIGATRALTEEERRIGRIAALVDGEKMIEERRRSEASLQATLIEMMMKRGYTEQEAKEELRLEAFRHKEYIGLGRSQRCKFDRVAC